MGSALLFLLGSPLSPCGAKVVGSWPEEEAEAEVSGGGGNPSSLPSCAHLHMRIRESVQVPTGLQIAKCESRSRILASCKSFSQPYLDTFGKLHIGKEASRDRRGIELL